MVNVLSLLSVLKNSKVLLPLIALLAIGGGYLLGYYFGYQKCDTEYQVQLIAGNFQNAQQIIKDEREKQAQANEITQKYLSDIEQLKADYEKQIEDVKSSKLSDVRIVTECVSDTSKNSTGMSAKANTKSDLLCYTESELRAKIEASLVIARECDQLAIKYNSLLEQCK